MRLPKSTLEQWSILQAVVDCGGYAKAAEKTHRSQSAISYAIKQLQDQLDVQLLMIDGRRARLTSNGEVLLARARHLVEDALRLEALVRSLQQGWESQVRLVVDAAFPLPALLSALRDFSVAHPNTVVQLQEVILSGADEAMLAGSADLVIGTRVPAGFLGDLLMSVDFVAVAHPGHPLHQLGREITDKDLESELQVVIQDSGRRNPRSDGWLGSERRWTVTSLETALASVCGGLGFAWLPEHLVLQSLEAGMIKPLPLCAGQRRQVSLHLMFVQPELAGPATRQLAEFIRASLQGAAA